MTDGPSVVDRSDLRIHPDDAGPLVAESESGVEATANHFSSDGAPRCGACNDVIGVYEPLVHVLDGSVRHTSRAAEPLLAYPGEGLYHLRCYESLDPEL